MTSKELPSSGMLPVSIGPSQSSILVLVGGASTFKLCHWVLLHSVPRAAMSGTLWIVKTTLPGEMNEAEVGMWCQSIIESNLAACVDTKRIKSVFRWEGQIQHSLEWDIQMKTSESRKNGLISKIKSEHSYDLPQIVWWSVESTVEYYNWVQG